MSQPSPAPALRTATHADAAAAVVVLPPDEWRARARAHRARIAERTDPLVALHMRGVRHPVHDFLFGYYNHSPAALQRWHPGAGVVLADDADGTAASAEAEETGAPPRGTWRHVRRVAPGEVEGAPDGGWAVDAEAFARNRGEGAAFTRELLARTAERAPRLGCFGLHEWAMAYRSDVHGVRHSTVPLRLGSAGTDAVVESQRIRCTHFDAFRFFAPEARGLNEGADGVLPTRAGMRDMEQPGCLHAGMDLYKWAYKLVPWVSSDLVADCFELAWDIRGMDMQASPYDLADWDVEPIRIETPEGRAEYVRRQRGFAERGQALRARLLDALEPLGAVVGATPDDDGRPGPGAPARG